MSEPDDNRGKKAKSREEIRSEEFIYKDAGIRERHGFIPFWLWLVAVALVAWGIYYTVHFWNPPPA